MPSAAAVAALGRPARETRFSLAAPLTEFRIRLLNHFRLPRDAATVVLERTWEHGACRLTIWFVQQHGQWRPVDALRWSAGDSF